MFYIFFTGNHTESTFIAGENIKMREKQFLETSKQFVNKTALPLPDGPSRIERHGNLVAFSYLLCLVLY